MVTRKLLFAASGWKPMGSVALPREDMASLVMSLTLLRPLLSSKHFVSLFSNGQGISEDNDSRIDTNRVDDLSAHPRTLRSFSKCLVHSISQTLYNSGTDHLECEVQCMI